MNPQAVVKNIDFATTILKPQSHIAFDRVENGRWYWKIKYVVRFDASATLELNTFDTRIKIPLTDHVIAGKKQTEFLQGFSFEYEADVSKEFSCPIPKNIKQ